MQNLDSPLTFSIIKTINDIPKDEWDRLFGQDLIESYGYQKTLEESSLKEFSFAYLVGKISDKFVAVFPFFIMDFSFDILTRGIIRKIILRFKKIFTFKVLFFGILTAEEFYLGISKEESLDFILNRGLEKISEFCQKEKISGIVFNNLSEKNNILIDYLTKKRFIKMETLPTTMIELKANSLEDYLGHLSRNARKDFKHKLRNSASKTHLAVEERQDVGDIIQDIHRLYLNNFSEPDVHFEILTPEFFLNISKNLPGVAKFFITKDGEKIVAFNLCLAKGDLLIDKFIGFDSELSRKYHLYFTTFAYNLEWCIKNGLQYYQPGQSDYYPKVRLGAKLIRLFDYTRAFNPLLHLILKLTAKFIEPKNIDSSLRDVEKIFRRG